MVGGIRSFKDLSVWQRAMELAKAVDRLTELFPRSEQFGLTAQARRASVSIPSNIAEGQARGHRAEYRQFLYVARGSMAELETQLILAEQLQFVPSAEVVLKSLGELKSMLLRLVKLL